MVIRIKTVPPAQDPRFVVACIRACIWASVEGRPFCPLTYGRASPKIKDESPQAGQPA